MSASLFNAAAKTASRSVARRSKGWLKQTTSSSAHPHCPSLCRGLSASSLTGKLDATLKSPVPSPGAPSSRRPQKKNGNRREAPPPRPNNTAIKPPREASPSHRPHPTNNGNNQRQSPPRRPLPSTASHISSQGIEAENEIYELSRSGHAKAPEQILAKMVQIAVERQTSRSDNPPPALTLKMLHHAMGALAKSASHYHQRSLRQAAQQIDDLLHLILEKQDSWHLKPTLRTYLIVLGAWERVEKSEKTGQASQRAEQVLNNLLAPFETKSHLKRITSHPNSMCFSTVMISWIHAGQPVRAEDLYRRMIRLYQTTRNEKVRPTTTMANLVSNGWAKVGQPDRILQWMKVARENVPLDRSSFNILLAAYAKLGQSDQAMALLGWMENEPNHQTTDDQFSDFFPIQGLQPDNTTYCSVLTALGKNQKVPESEAVLERLKARGMTPDRFVYTALIHNCVTIIDPQKVQKTYNWWQECPDVDVACSTTFLQVCAHALRPERSKALDLAMQVYESMEGRNDVAYYMMAKVINQLVVWGLEEGEEDYRWATKDHVAAERRRFLQVVARDCCETGHLSTLVRDELELNTRDTVAVLMGSKNGLRPEWSREIPHRFRPSSAEPTRK